MATIEEGNIIKSEGITDEEKSNRDENEEDVTKFIERKRLDDTACLNFRDKIFFVLGVANLLLLCYGFFSAPYILPYLYTIKAPILIGYRLFYYGAHKWHLFLLDFCYFANILVLIYLWVFPHSGSLFVIVFALSHGPLTFAIIAFRNSLVFHSVDKITSMFIHISPPLLLHM